MEVKVKKCDIGVMGLMSSEVDSAVGILVKGGVRWWDGGVAMVIVSTQC